MQKSQVIENIRNLNPATISSKPVILHASFEETHHRESDGVSSTLKDNWRTRANNKPKKVLIRSGQ